MPETINGLPLHVLLVHGVIVFVPLAALLVVLSAIWPAARRRLGFITPLVALIALIMTPLAANAGSWLMARVYSITPAIQEHADLGDTMIWFSIGLFVAALLVWGVPLLLIRQSNEPPAPWIGVVVAVISIALAAASVVQVVRVGEAGSKAVWAEGTFCAEPVVNGSCPTA